MHGCESWVLTKAQEEKLGVAQMRMLRSIMRIRLIDHVENDVIRTRTSFVVVMKFVCNQTPNVVNFALVTALFVMRTACFANRPQFTGGNDGGVRYPLSPTHPGSGVL